MARTDTQDAQPRRLEYMPVDAIEEALVNPKDHDDALIDASMGRFGFMEIPVLDERTGRLVAGHGRRSRVMALRDAGDDPPEGVVVDKDGTWLLPVARGWSSKDDDDAHAAGIALNRGAEAGGWKVDVLFDVLNGFSTEPDGLVGLGFDVHELDDMVADLATTNLSFDPEVSSDQEGAHAEDSIQTRAQRYAGKGVRSLILDYPLTDFDELAATCARLRRWRKVETNAQLMAVLIREEADRLPAEYDPPPDVPPLDLLADDQGDGK